MEEIYRRVTRMKINIVDFEDWTCIYIDGELKFEDHRAEATDMLKVLGFEYEHEFIEGWDYDKQPPDKYEELHVKT